MSINRCQGEFSGSLIRLESKRRTSVVRGGFLLLTELDQYRGYSFTWETLSQSTFGRLILVANHNSFLSVYSTSQSCWLMISSPCFKTTPPWYLSLTAFVSTLAIGSTSIQSLTTLILLAAAEWQLSLCAERHSCLTLLSTCARHHFCDLQCLSSRQMTILANL